MLSVAYFSRVKATRYTFKNDQCGYFVEKSLKQDRGETRVPSQTATGMADGNSRSITEARLPIYLENNNVWIF